MWMMGAATGRGFVQFGADATWKVPGGVSLLKKVVLVAPGGPGGSSFVGSGSAGGGGGGGGEIAIATDVPVVPGTDFVFDALFAGGSNETRLTHPTLGTLSVQWGKSGGNATSETSAGSGGDGGGAGPISGSGGVGFSGSDGDGGNALLDAGTSVDTTTWTGVSITRVGGGGGGGGGCDSAPFSPPFASGGAGRANGQGNGGGGGLGGSAGVVANGGEGGAVYSALNPNGANFLIDASGATGGDSTPPLAEGVVYIEW